MTLDEATVAADDLEQRLRREFPGVSRVDVHLEPLEPELVRGTDVTVAREELAGEIRRLVEAHPEVRRSLDVELSERSGGLVAHVVAEMAGQVKLEHAHEVETQIEDRLRQALPELTEVVARVAP